MKNTFFILFVLTLMLGACSKNKNEPQPEPEQQTSPTIQNEINSLNGKMFNIISSNRKEYNQTKIHLIANAGYQDSTFTVVHKDSAYNFTPSVNQFRIQQVDSTGIMIVENSKYPVDTAIRVDHNGDMIADELPNPVYVLTGSTNDYLIFSDLDTYFEGLQMYPKSSVQFNKILSNAGNLVQGDFSQYFNSVTISPFDNSLFVGTIFENSSVPNFTEGLFEQIWIARNSNIAKKYYMVTSIIGAWGNWNYTNDGNGGILGLAYPTNHYVRFNTESDLPFGSKLWIDSVIVQ